MKIGFSRIGLTTLGLITGVLLPFSAFGASAPGNAPATSARAGNAPAQEFVTEAIRADSVQSGS